MDVSEIIASTAVKILPRWGAAVLRPYWRVPSSARLRIRCEARVRLSSGHSPAVGLSRSFFKIASTKCQKNYLELMEFEACLEHLRWMTARFMRPGVRWGTI